MIPHPNQTTAIRVCSLNVNHSNAATHAAMHVMSTQTNPPFNILLIQDPWCCKANSTFQMFSFAGWKLTLPKSTIQQNERPRTTPYHKTGTERNQTPTHD